MRNIKLKADAIFRTSVKSNKIDVYFEDHQRALDFGVQHKEVFVYE